MIIRFPFSTIIKRQWYIFCPVPDTEPYRSTRSRGTGRKTYKITNCGITIIHSTLHYSLRRIILRNLCLNGIVLGIGNS
jgi:hypothetical protein